MKSLSYIELRVTKCVPHCITFSCHQLELENPLIVEKCLEGSDITETRAICNSRRMNLKLVRRIGKLAAYLQFACANLDRVSRDLQYEDEAGA